MRVEKQNPPPKAPDNAARPRGLLGLSGIGWAAVGLATLAAVAMGFWTGRVLRSGGISTLPVAADSAGVPSSSVAAEPVAGLSAEPDAPLPHTPQGVIDEVRPAIEHLGKTFPEHLDALEMKARFFDWLGESDRAAEIWNACLQRNPDYVHALVGLASLAARQADYGRAIELGRQAVRAAPAEFLARAVLAEALIHNGQPAEAVSLLEPFVNSDPRSQGFYLLGQAFYQLEQFDKAARSYEAAIQRYPDYAEAYHGLSQAYARLGQPEKARAALGKFRSFTTPQQAARRIRGMITSDLKTVLREAAILLTDAGRIYLVQKKPAEAERLWRRAAAYDANNLPCRQSLAFLCRQGGRKREAAFWLEKAAALDAKNPSYWVEIGNLWAELWDQPAAEKAFRKAIAVAPESGQGQAALASWLLQTGRNLPEALVQARAAVKYAPTGPHYAVLAAACRRNGDLGGALAAAEQAARLSPADPAIHQLLEALRAEKGGKPAAPASGKGQPTSLTPLPRLPAAD